MSSLQGTPGKEFQHLVMYNFKCQAKDFGFHLGRNIVGLVGEREEKDGNYKEKICFRKINLAIVLRTN